MAITNGYCTLAEFKLYAKITSTDTNDDAVIEDIVEGISRQIDEHCGRAFYQTTESRYFNTRDIRKLRTSDIATTSGLAVYSDTNGDGVYENTLATTDYNLTPYNPISGWPYEGLESTLIATSYLSTARKGNKITATFGWPSIPDKVRQACLIASEAEYHSRFGENMSAVATVTAAGVMITPRGMPISAVQKLSPYRRVL